VTILLCREETSQNPKEGDAVDLASLVATYGGELCTVEVPDQSPSSLQQFREWNTVWPCKSFRQPPVSEEKTSKELSSLEIVFEQHMREAIHLACVAREAGYAPVGAVIVDPTSSRVLGSSHDRTHDGCIMYRARASIPGVPYPQQADDTTCPLQHAVMLAIEAVACWNRTVFASSEAVLNMEVDAPILPSFSSRDDRSISLGSTLSRIEEEGPWTKKQRLDQVDK